MARRLIKKAVVEAAKRAAASKKSKTGVKVTSTNRSSGEKSVTYKPLTSISAGEFNGGRKTSKTSNASGVKTNTGKLRKEATPRKAVTPAKRDSSVIRTDRRLYKQKNKRK